MKQVDDITPRNHKTENVENDIPFWQKWGSALSRLFVAITPAFVIKAFMRIDKKVDGAISFFLRHYGKTPFMISMSKKVQYLGIEKLFLKGPKAFVYFFLFYLVRDTILYIIIPIYFAKLTTGN